MKKINSKKMSPSHPVHAWVQQLYWNSPLGQLVGLVLAIVIGFISVKVVTFFGWSPIFFVLPVAVLIVATVLIFRKRGKRLEAEALAVLPRGWHLVYTFRPYQKRFAPELVSDRDFKRILVKRKTTWGRFLNAGKLTGKDLTLEKARTKRDRSSSN